MAKHLSESDTRAKYIDPNLKKVGWDEAAIVREYYFTDGRKLLGDKRGKRLFVDYLLRYNGTNLALIEAKRNDKHPTEGLQQAIDYAEKLKINIIYSSNGERIYQFDLREGKGQYVDDFLAPDALYDLNYRAQNETKKKLLEIPFYLTGAFRPRYYQEIAVNKVMENLADGQNRMLLTLATGTGKTFISFQIVHKLLEGKWNIDRENRRPRILFLADRNILADQAINTFNPYENDLIKINGEEVRKRNGEVPTNAYIFFAIYQAIADRENQDQENIGGYYRQYPSDFFDIVIIDECHRGSANDEGSWRQILDHFKPAVHLGLTATPKREDNVDTYKYFGKPIYEYSLRDGIADGFLTPYKVKRITTNIDEYIHTNDNEVIKGVVTKGRYEIKDFERIITVDQRTDLIVRAILNHIQPMDKTIVFCVNQEHALTMRDMINNHKEIRDPKYCVRVTSDEGSIGIGYLEDFQNNDKDIPAILTSSQMLTTGVDARNVRNIVIVRTINSHVEFKQIIGRGTRLFDGKDFFTIIDFTGATNAFYDKDWDGPPEEEIDTTEGSSREKKKSKPYKKPVESGGEVNEPEEKLAIKLSNGHSLKVTNVDMRYIDENGRPLTVREFLEKLVGNLPSLFKDEKQLRIAWANPETRSALLEKLGQLGFDKEQLEALRLMVASPAVDIFDVLAHISFSAGIKTRKERVINVKGQSQKLSIYSDLKAKEFLEFILDHYERYGSEELSQDKLGDLVKLKLGTPKDAKIAFGDLRKLKEAYYMLQEQIYEAS
ncbi:DEAD/DEAH box helicase family protein [uncultured Cyclobacterium sp.]|uniref:EcoAI/FtnUII family type I restriction enzme subunit R n=1 Tax=uncultured Cyclobacterium sp. TaxID=453820 RepID=UPI0030EE445B